MTDLGVLGASSPAIIQARQHLARADVDADRAAHSPGCIAVDQKHADQARAALTQASHAAARDMSSAATAGIPPGIDATTGGASFPVYA